MGKTLLMMTQILVRGLCTKDVHPKGGRGGFKIVDENGHGGRGVLEEWMSHEITFEGFVTVPKYS